MMTTITTLLRGLLAKAWPSRDDDWPEPTEQEKVETAEARAALERIDLGPLLKQYRAIQSRHEASAPDDELK